MASGGFEAQGSVKGCVCECSTAAVEVLYVISHTAGQPHSGPPLPPGAGFSRRRRLQQTVIEPGCRWLFLEGVRSVSLGIALNRTQQELEYPPSATHMHRSHTYAPPPNGPATLGPFLPLPIQKGITRNKYHQPRPILSSPLTSPSRGLTAVRLRSLIPNGVPGTPAGSVPGQRLRGVPRSRPS